MKTRYFTGEVEKRLDHGRFWVGINAHGPGGEEAGIFWEDHLRSELKWDSQGECCSTRVFDTADEAILWIKEVHDRLKALDAIYEKRLKELRSLPEE